MKRVLSIVAVVVFAFASCNNSDTSSANHENHGAGQTTSETAGSTEEAKAIKPTFATLDAGVANHVKDVFDHYIHVKTALVNSNPKEAKKGADAILQVLKSFDRSLLSTEHKGAYDKSIPGIRSAAEGIAGSSDVAQQREYFAQLSTSAYDLAKSFGGGKTLYHDHCPMAFDHKGAMWLSEQKEIKNPYYGEEMLECGTIEEVIQKP
jgi:hypothetical protein